MITKDDLAPVTVVLTSCNRFDLLRETLASFFEHYEGALRDFIVIEDSGSEEVKKVTDQFKGLFAINVIINNPNLGQLASIDKAYSLVESPYIFHLEDDWIFTRKGFIQESLKILEKRDDVFSIWLRDIKEFSSHKGEVEIDGKSFYQAEDVLSFNPALRRLSDYKLVAPYAQFIGSKAFELDLSKLYEKQGKFSLVAKTPATEHIGWHRRVRWREKSRLPRFILALEQIIKRWKSKFYRKFSLKHFKKKN